MQAGIGTIAIVGGGVAGWMAAAACARLIRRDYCKIVVIEGSRARGAAAGAVPAFQRFNNLLGISDTDFVRRMRATYKLGSVFRDWLRPGHSFFHTFAGFGGDIAAVPFHHYWLRQRQQGDETEIGDYSIATAAAKLERFAPPATDSRSVLSLYSHSYHFDTNLYADCLRDYALARGVAHSTQNVVDAELRGDDGFIKRLVLDDGGRIEADLFIDCSEPPGVLIERTLKVGREDWSHWLPCDRAVRLSRTPGQEISVCSVSQAQEAGWIWRIPLQDRIESGYVYCSEFLDDEAAVSALTADPVSRAEAEIVRFPAGRLRKFWQKNCVALPGSMLEPLEATTIQLVQSGILKLFSTFPDKGFNPADSDEYNRLTVLEHERIRDFLILHYCSTNRTDNPFWSHCSAMEVPQTLQHKLELFRSSGRICMLDNEHFGEQSWLSLYLGHNIIPRRYDPLADVMDAEDVKKRLAKMKHAIGVAAQSLPTQCQYLERIATSGRETAK